MGEHTEDMSIDAVKACIRTNYLVALCGGGDVYKGLALELARVTKLRAWLQRERKGWEAAVSRLLSEPL